MAIHGGDKSCREGDNSPMIDLMYAAAIVYAMGWASYGIIMAKCTDESPMIAFLCAALWPLFPFASLLERFRR